MPKLTRRQIDTAVVARRQTILWDGELRGFGCRISAKGKASWIIAKRFGAGGRGARMVWQSFGTLADTTPEEARRKAIELLNEVREGVDLPARKRQQRHDEQSAYHNGRLKDVWELWYQRNAKPGRYWPEIKRRYEVDVFPTLKPATLLTNITRKDIRALIDDKEATSKSGARLLFSALRPFFRWCVERELITVSPCDGITPPKLLASRDRVLTDDEVRLVWNGCLKIGWPFGDCYRLLMLTGQRRDEVAGMRWAELDLLKGTWIIPKERTKNHREHLVHLSPQAIEIIKALPRTEGSPFVLSTNGKTPISGWSKAKRELDAIAKIDKPWRIHDLRRTAATGMAALGFAPHIAERVLNHITGTTSGIAGVYQRFEFQEERKKALHAWGRHIDGLMTGEQSNVVAFRPTPS